MTTCPYCLMTAARGHRQLQNRLRNIKKFSDVKVFECPKCGGTEWTTTEAMVEPEPRPKWLALRDAIERIASDLFDEAPTIQGYVIRIFTKHLRRQPPGCGAVPNRNEHQPHAKRPRRASLQSQINTDAHTASCARGPPHATLPEPSAPPPR